jgi:hypothetical protein
MGNSRTTIIADVALTFSRCVQAVKEIYAEWTALAGQSEDWRHMVLLLGSLQGFANALPVPMRPRAREFVAPALAPVIQARSLGRTYSTRLQADVLLEDADQQEVLTALRLERLAEYIPCEADVGKEQGTINGASRKKRPRAADEVGEQEVGGVYKRVAVTAEDLRVTLQQLVASGEGTGELPIVRLVDADGHAEVGEEDEERQVAVLLLNSTQLEQLRVGLVVPTEGIKGLSQAV